MKIELPKRISSDYLGYHELIELYHEIKNSSSHFIQLDFYKTNWFEANLAAVFGAILELASNSKKNITTINLKHNIRNVLCRNTFLCELGEHPLIDTSGTTISYQQYTPDEDDKFKNYIKNELLSKPDFPKHSIRLGKKINESIFELYENARTHGKCKRIHTCGQYFPNKSPKRLYITIVDMGQTIKANVNQFLSTPKSGSEAIIWALKYGNTTKTGNIPGGLGLDSILEFIKLNKGKVQIVSSDGYWEYKNGEAKKEFNNFFPGTIVNIEFNLDDSSIYKLKEEDISFENIF